MATPIPTNRAPFTLSEVAAATGGTLTCDGPPVTGVSTDTRTITPGALFVALSGESFDGHRFLAQAASAGSSAFLVSDASALPPGAAAVVVPDTRRALGALARLHRDRWGVASGGRLVAVVGSAGKTTTTRSIAAVLGDARPGAVHSTPGNLNNDVGLPMTLLLLELTHRLAVVEVGTNHRGEVANLATVARPDAGVLTLIAPEHTEGIGNLDEVEAEEGDLLAALPPGGFAAANADDERVVRQVARTRARPVLYGASAGASVRLLSRTLQGAAGSRLEVLLPGRAAPFRVDVPLLGEAGVYAALAALAVASEVLPELPTPELVTAALSRVARERDGRLVPVTTPNGTVVLDDSYNSNSGSLPASVRTAREVASALGRRLVLALGEMREMGDLAPAEHESMGEVAAGARPDLVVAVAGEAGRIARRAAEAGIPSRFFDVSSDAAAFVVTAVRPGDVVLVKGSRSVGMEKVVHALVPEAGAAAHG